MNAGRLSLDQHKHLDLHDFVTNTQIEHETSRDILSEVNWDLSAALNAAKEMGHITSVESTISQSSSLSSISSSTDSSNTFENFLGMKSVGCNTISRNCEYIMESCIHVVKKLVRAECVWL